MRWWWAGVHAVLAAALGIAAGVVTQGVLAEPDPAGAAARGDRVDAALEGVRQDHVWVAPDARSQLSEAGERRLEKMIASVGPPVYVVVWTDSRSAGYEHYIQAAEQIVAALPAPAAVVLWGGPDASTMEVSEGFSWESTDGSYVYVEAPEFLGDPERRVTEWLGTLAGTRLVEHDDDSEAPPLLVGLAAGVPLGLLGAFGVWFAIGMVRVSTGRGFRNRPR